MLVAEFFVAGWFVFIVARMLICESFWVVSKLFMRGPHKLLHNSPRAGHLT